MTVEPARPEGLTTTPLSFAPPVLAAAIVELSPTAIEPIVAFRSPIFPASRLGPPLRI